LETPAGAKAIERAVSLILKANPDANAEIVRYEMIHLAHAYYSELEMTGAQSPKDAVEKLRNVETQAGALYRALRDMGGLAGAYFTNLADQETAALTRDMETIQKIKSRAKRLSESIQPKKGQETPAKEFLVCCRDVLKRLNCQDSSLPPKIGRAIHSAVTGEKEEKGSQQFDAPWKALLSSP